MSRSAEDMSSAGFVAFAIEVARSQNPWDEAERCFPGQPRWEIANEPEPSGFRVEPDAEPQPA
jgi:hypothetical protein